MKKFWISVAFFLLRLALIVGIGYALVYLGRYAYDFGYQIYSDKGMEDAPGTDIAVVIYEDQSVSDIAQMLEKFHLIQDQKVFILQERLSKYHGQIKAGNYILNTSYSGNRMVEILSGGEPETESAKEN